MYKRQDLTRAARASFPIHCAIDWGDEELAMSELASPGNVERAKIHGVTPLMMAARSGSRRIAQNLLDRGAKSERRSEHGCTAMYIAAEEGHVNIMKAILDCDVPAERLLTPDHLGAGPLMRASENGHVDAVRLLLQYTSKKQCNASNQKGWNAMLLAAYNGFPDVVRLLLAHGANPELGKKHGQRAVHTPLCYACQTGRLEVVQVLMKAEVTAQYGLEKQAAPIALKLAQDNEHDRCVEVLKQAGVTTEGVFDKAEAGAPAADTAQKRGQDQAQNAEAKKGANAASNKTTAMEHTATIVDLKAQLEAVKVREDEVLSKMGEIKDQLDSMKAALRRAKKSSGEQAKEEKTRSKGSEKKPPWTFSPSGRWLPGLWAGSQERGGVISNEFGEPPHSISFADVSKLAQEVEAELELEA